MKYYRNGNTVIQTMGTLALPEITKEEYEATMKPITARMEVSASIYEAHRPMTMEEAFALVIPQQINAIVMDDNTALRMLAYYPEWVVGETYAAGYKVKRNGKLWRTVQPHTSQIGWEPENTASLWEQINETHAGTADDPIPYDGNMALENGKHYMQDYVVYLCVRDTVNPVYNALAELVGLYVEVV